MTDLDVSGTDTSLLIHSYKTIDRRIREWESIRDDLKRRIQQAMGDSEVAIDNGRPVIRWTQVISKRLDTTLVKKRFSEDDLADCWTEQVTRRFITIEPPP